jgi:hypothetical protein
MFIVHAKKDVDNNFVVEAKKEDKTQTSDTYNYVFTFKMEVEGQKKSKLVASILKTTANQSESLGTVKEININNQGTLKDLATPLESGEALKCYNYIKSQLSETKKIEVHPLSTTLEKGDEFSIYIP